MNNKIKTNNLINTCYCYEGYSPYTKNGCCRFCFGIHQISNNTSLINKKEDKTSHLFTNINLKQTLIDLFKNNKK